MTADEMFKELGYINREDKHRIEYTIIQNFTHFNTIKKIYFYKIEKNISIEEWIVIESIKISVSLTIKELQAINKKCEEMGWI